MKPIKLCYKKYKWALNLGAMRQFSQVTGGDLWNELLTVLSCYNENHERDALVLLKEIASCVSFEKASHILHCLIQQKDKNVELEQIQDAMFRVGWRPVELEDGEYIQPYTLVLVDVATQIDKQFQVELPVKKKQQNGAA